MKTFLINIMKKSQFLRSLLRKLVYIKKSIIYQHYRKKNEVNPKMVIFESFMGRAYSDNPRAIYEQMLKDDQYQDYEFIWCFREGKLEEQSTNETLRRARLVKYNSYAYYRYYSMAKYWVSNSRIPEAIKPKKEQVYIQTWHGTPLKRLGYDLTAEGGNAMNSLNDMKKKYKDDAERYTYLLSPSAFCTEKFKSCFNLKENNPNCKIVEKGYPRNDFMSNYTEEDVKRIKNILGLNNIKNKKVILYAPTWRDNQHTAGIGYTYKTNVDFDFLQEKLGNDYIILFRAHYFVANTFDFEKYKGFIYNVSDYGDINELYVIADCLITDYSSVFFDYAILHRPIIFYMYDLEAYEDDVRGFYINLEELPGPILRIEEELVSEIQTINHKDFYDLKYKKFNEKFNSLEDGHASERAIDIIMKKQNSSK